MSTLKKVYRSLFIPVTIMLVPHSCRDTFRVKMPAALILSVFIFSIIGAGYVFSIVDDALHYEPTRKELEYYKGQFAELESTIASLDMAEKQFNDLFAMDNVPYR